ncbi:hypothetical protein BJ742DRAFT_875481 [Cladochytrium replicatum]|nr:hypothetical protein BJ742DRAFT_875481 [Cladochytrium replicatum]
MSKILILLVSFLIAAVSAQDVEILLPPGKTELLKAFRAVGIVKFACRDGIWRFAGPEIELYPLDSCDLYANVVTDNTGEPVITEAAAVGNGVWSGKRTQVRNSTNPEINAFQILFEKTEVTGTGLLAETYYVTQTEVTGGAAPVECDSTELLQVPIEATYSFFKKTECVIVKRRARTYRN